MRRSAVLTMVAALLLVGSTAVVAERNLESGSAGSEPQVGCGRVIATKATAGKKISRAKLASKLHLSVEQVNDCLGPPRHSVDQRDPKEATTDRIEPVSE
jgi:hypothetical protein